MMMRCVPYSIEREKGGEWVSDGWAVLPLTSATLEASVARRYTGEGVRLVAMALDCGDAPLPTAHPSRARWMPQVIREIEDRVVARLA